MAIITLARQVGSGGHSIAAALADRLDYRVYGRHELRGEAESAGLVLPRSFEAFASEQHLAAAGPSGPSRLYVSYGELEFDEALRGLDVDSSAAHPSFLDALRDQRREILLALQATVYRLAAGDRVILVGAGTQILLAETPGVLRAKIIASEEVRAERLSSAYGMTLADAQTAVRQADQEQRDYNQAIFGADWDEPLLWDLVINSDNLPVETASAWIASLVTRPPFSDQPDTSIRAALATAAEINHRLWTNPGMRAAAIVAVPAGDAVCMRGDAPNAADRDAAMAVGAASAATVELRDEILITHISHLPGPG